MSSAGATPAGKVAATCERCVHRLEDQRVLERRLPGLTSFGSAYGASIAASRLCALHDCWVSPEDGCARFSTKG